MITLRDYQSAALDRVFAYWAEGGGNPLVEMATGTGKSATIGALVRNLVEQWPDMRVLMLVHVKELVQQNAATLLRMWPQAPLGINAAGLHRRDRHSQILFASIQSIYREDSSSIGKRDLVVIDESHLVPKSGDGMYRTLLENLRKGVPDMRCVGFTATPYRLGEGRLDKGDDRLFDDLVYTYGIGQAIADGWLSPLVSKAGATEIDVSGVARRGGEFVAGALEAAADKDDVTEAAAAEIVRYGENRRAWLVFCAGVKHAGHVRDALRRLGISAEMVSGETPMGERDRIIQDFRAGRIRALTNAMVLTTGFDVPHVDLVAMLRPTLSTGLYVQIVGRATRLAEGKENALVLDFAGNVRRHGPVDIAAPPERKKGAGGSEAGVAVDTVRAKTCPDCGYLVAINTLTCTVCGHEWPAPPPKPAHEPTADVTPILSTQIKRTVDEITVTDWEAARHTKRVGPGEPPAPPTMRVEYWGGVAAQREWICFEHPPGFARRKAEAWWSDHGGDTPTPSTIDEAIERFDELQRPAVILVRPPKGEHRYSEIVGRRFPRYGSNEEAAE